jgi:5-methylcytosine-specific restriction enzyme B
MARRQEHEPLYKAIRDFFDACLIHNKSLLWPQNEYWTLQNLYLIKKRLIESAILGAESSFEEKLEIQMKDASEAEWAIICDIYYVYFLPSSYIKINRKINEIEQA